jgi:sec-independent protein translocase protein TatB
MDLGMSELLVIGIVALVVIGPKDLPEMFRQLGRMTAKMRAMAREFSRAMEQAAKETGVNDIARDLKTVTSPKSMGLEAVKGAMDKFEKWDPIKNAAKPSSAAAVGAKPLVPPAMPATPAAAPVPVPAVEPSIMGPNTAALYDKQAKRAAILRESAEKLKALDAETETESEPETAPEPADAKPRRSRKPKDLTTPVPEAVAKPAAKSPRKKKAAET